MGQLEVTQESQQAGVDQSSGAYQLVVRVAGNTLLSRDLGRSFIHATRQLVRLTHLLMLVSGGRAHPTTTRETSGDQPIALMWGVRPIEST